MDNLFSHRLVRGVAQWNTEWVVRPGPLKKRRQYTRFRRATTF